MIGVDTSARPPARPLACRTVREHFLAFFRSKTAYTGSSMPCPPVPPTDRNPKPFVSFLFRATGPTGGVEGIYNNRNKKKIYRNTIATCIIITISFTSPPPPRFALQRRFYARRTTYRALRVIDENRKFNSTRLELCVFFVSKRSVSYAPATMYVLKIMHPRINKHVCMYNMCQSALLARVFY